MRKTDLRNNLFIANPLAYSDLRYTNNILKKAIFYASNHRNDDDHIS